MCHLTFKTSTSRVSDNNTMSKIKNKNEYSVSDNSTMYQNLKLLAAVEIFDVFSSRQFKDV